MKGIESVQQGFKQSPYPEDKYDTLEEVLAEKLKDQKLKGMVNELLDACVKITEAPKSGGGKIKTPDWYGNQTQRVEMNRIWGAADVETR